jgi:hypothetical protein
VPDPLRDLGGIWAAITRKFLSFDPNERGDSMYSRIAAVVGASAAVVLALHGLRVG